MTRRITALAIVVLVALVASSMAGDTDEKWFDMENCAMCKNLSSQEGLLEAMTWESHPISNGVVAVSTVKSDFLAAYYTAHDGMGKTGEKLMGGEQLHLCKSCSALGMCMMQGVSQDYVKTMSGDVWIVTSDKEDVVAMLHDWANKNMEAMKNM